MPASAMERGIRSFGAFLCFAALMAGLAGFTLTWQGTGLDAAWRLNPNAHDQMAPYGWRAGIAFLFLCGTLIAALVGWFQRRYWGWRLAVIVIFVQFGGDVMNLFRGQVFQGFIGVLVAGTLLAFLLRTNTRAEFR